MRFPRPKVKQSCICTSVRENNVFTTCTLLSGLSLCRLRFGSTTQRGWFWSLGLCGVILTESWQRSPRSPSLSLYKEIRQVDVQLHMCPGQSLTLAGLFWTDETLLFLSHSTPAAFLVFGLAAAAAAAVRGTLQQALALHAVPHAVPKVDQEA